MSSQSEVAWWVPHYIRFTSILFDVIRPSHSWDMDIWKTMTWKIQVQGYGWVRRSRSHSGPNNLSTHIPFVPYHSSLPFLIFSAFKTLKIQGQDHGWVQSSKSQSGFDFLSTHISFVPCQSILPFLIYNFYKIWPWKSTIMVMEQFLSTHVPFVPCQSTLPFLRYG